MVYILTWGVVLTASASAVVAFVWSLERGQLDDLERGARVIFADDDTADGEQDSFPAPRNNL